MALEYRAKGADFGAWLEANAGKIGYLIGTRGQTCTQSMINYRLASTAYQSYWTNIRNYASKWLGKVVCDCMGVYECFLSGGAYNKPLSSWKYSDVTTGTVYALAKSEGLKNGLIATLPKDCPFPIAVGYDGHVGFFYKGKVYQSSGHAYGLEITDLTSTAHNHAWQYWYYLPWLDYTVLAQESGGEYMLYKGCPDGEPVKEWQESLIKVLPGALPKYGADKDFGGETELWTNKFKASVGLPQDGKVDDITYAKMLNKLQSLVSSVSQSAYDSAIAKVTDLSNQLLIANNRIANGVKALQG